MSLINKGYINSVINRTDRLYNNTRNNSQILDNSYVINQFNAGIKTLEDVLKVTNSLMQKCRKLNELSFLLNNLEKNGIMLSIQVLCTQITKLGEFGNVAEIEKLFYANYDNADSHIFSAVLLGMSKNNEYDKLLKTFYYILMQEQMANKKRKKINLDSTNDDEIDNFIHELGILWAL